MVSLGSQQLTFLMLVTGKRVYLSCLILKCCRVIWVLQSGALLVFSICWVAVLDYLVFMFTCSWGHGNTHLHWEHMGEYCPTVVQTWVCMPCSCCAQTMNIEQVHAAPSLHHCHNGQ